MIYRRYHPYAGQAVLCLAVLIIMAAIVSAMMGLASLVDNNAQVSEVKNYKYYTSVEVKNGDTLWDLASEHATEEYRSLQEYVDEVKALNGLQSDYIRSGQCLVIPYYSSEFK